MIATALAIALALVLAAAGAAAQPRAWTVTSRGHSADLAGDQMVRVCAARVCFAALRDGRTAIADGAEPGGRR